MEYQAKLNEDYMPVLFLSQVLKLLFINSFMMQFGFRWVLRRGLETRGKSSEIV